MSMPDDEAKGCKIPDPIPADPGWMCDCGHYEDSDFHCRRCQAEPPWGCDCDFCNSPPEEEYFEDEPSWLDSNSPEFDFGWEGRIYD
jgi:hypothetical protein